MKEVGKCKAGCVGIYSNEEFIRTFDIICPACVFVLFMFA